MTIPAFDLPTLLSLLGPKPKPRPHGAVPPPGPYGPPTPAPQWFRDLAAQQRAERQAQEREARHQAFLRRRAEINARAAMPPQPPNPEEPTPFERRYAQVVASSPLVAAPAGAFEFLSEAPRALAAAATTGIGKLTGSERLQHAGEVAMQPVRRRSRAIEEALGNAPGPIGTATRFGYGLGELGPQLAGAAEIPGMQSVMRAAPALQGVISPLERAAVRTGVAYARGSVAGALGHAAMAKPLAQLPEAAHQGGMGFATFEAPLSLGGETLGAARMMAGAARARGQERQAGIRTIARTAQPAQRQLYQNLLTRPQAAGVAEQGTPYELSPMEQKMRDLAERSQRMLPPGPKPKPPAPPAPVVPRLRTRTPASGENYTPWAKLSGKWYSRLERVIATAPQQKQAGAQWAAWLKNKGGFAPQEAEYRGLSDFLTRNAQTTLTKQEVLGSLSPIEVGEIRQGPGMSPIAKRLEVTRARVARQRVRIDKAADLLNRTASQLPAPWNGGSAWRDAVEQVRGELAGGHTNPANAWDRVVEQYRAYQTYRNSYSLDPGLQSAANRALEGPPPELGAVREAVTRLWGEHATHRQLQERLTALEGDVGGNVERGQYRSYTPEEAEFKMQTSERAPGYGEVLFGGLPERGAARPLSERARLAAETRLAKKVQHAGRSVIPMLDRVFERVRERHPGLQAEVGIPGRHPTDYYQTRYAVQGHVDRMLSEGVDPYQIQSYTDLKELYRDATGAQRLNPNRMGGVSLGAGAVHPIRAARLAEALKTDLQHAVYRAEYVPELKRIARDLARVGRLAPAIDALEARAAGRVPVSHSHWSQARNVHSFVRSTQRPVTLTDGRTAQALDLTELQSDMANLTRGGQTRVPPEELAGLQPAAAAVRPALEDLGQEAQMQPTLRFLKDQSQRDVPDPSSYTNTGAGPLADAGKFYNDLLLGAGRPLPTAYDLLDAQGGRLRQADDYLAKKAVGPRMMKRVQLEATKHGFRAASGMFESGKDLAAFIDAHQQEGATALDQLREKLARAEYEAGAPGRGMDPAIAQQSANQLRRQIDMLETALDPVRRQPVLDALQEAQRIWDRASMARESPEGLVPAGIPMLKPEEVNGFAIRWHIQEAVRKGIRHITWSPAEQQRRRWLGSAANPQAVGVRGPYHAGPSATIPLDYAPGARPYELEYETAIPKAFEDIGKKLGIPLRVDQAQAHLATGKGTPPQRFPVYHVEIPEAMATKIKQEGIYFWTPTEAYNRLRESEHEIAHGPVEGAPAAGVREAAMRWKPPADVEPATLVGQSIANPKRLYQALYHLRDPKVERLHLVFRRGRKVVGHLIYTSGEDVMATPFRVVKGEVDPSEIARFYEKVRSIQRRTGATHIDMGHNHPSGDSQPSWPDVIFPAQMEQELQARGVPIQLGHVLVIDHEVAHVITPVPGLEPLAGMMQAATPKALGVPGFVKEVPLGREVGPDWTHVQGGRISSPAQAGQLMRHVDQLPDGTFGVVYADVHGVTVAFAPHRGSAARTIGTWLPQELRRYGANRAFLVGDFTTGAGGQALARDLHGVLNVEQARRFRGTSRQSLRGGKLPIYDVFDLGRKAQTLGDQFPTHYGEPSGDAPFSPTRRVLEGEEGPLEARPYSRKPGAVTPGSVRDLREQRRLAREAQGLPPLTRVMNRAQLDPAHYLEGDALDPGVALRVGDRVYAGATRADAERKALTNLGRIGKRAGQGQGRISTEAYEAERQRLAAGAFGPFTEGRLVRGPSRPPQFVTHAQADVLAARAREPETILAPAIERPGQPPFVGADHGEAYDRAFPEEAAARQPGATWSVEPGRNPATHQTGFVTSRGRFLGRDEAARLASQVGQVDEPRNYDLLAHDLVNTEASTPEGRAARLQELRLRGMVQEVPTPYLRPDFKPDAWTNTNKLEADPEGRQVLETEIQRVVDRFGAGALRKVKVPHAQTLAEARAAGIDLRGLDGEVVPTHARADILGAGQVIAANVDRMAELAKVASDLSVPEVQRLEAGRRMELLQGQNTHLLYGLIRSKSEGGRLLNSFKIVAQKTLDPTFWLTRATQLARRPLTPEETVQITRLLQERDRDGLAQTVVGLSQTPVTRQLIDLWKAGLLTNPKTHVVNVTSNLTMAALEAAKDPAAATADMLMRPFTGRRTKGALSPVALAQASLRGAQRGVLDARRAMRGTGNVNKLLEHPRTNVTILGWKPLNAIANRYLDVVFNTLSAEDAYFRALAFRRSLVEQVTLEARQSGLRGTELRQRIADAHAIVEGREPKADIPNFDRFATQAATDAEVATFQDRTRLGEAAQAFSKLGPVGEVILPFKKTPGAVATRILEYSPLGAARGIGQMVQVALKGADAPIELQRAAAEAAGRGLTGSFLMFMGYKLAEAGVMQGALPTSGTEARTAQISGRTANSLLAGPVWLRIGRISPIGNLLSVGASLHDMVAARQATLPERAAQVGAASLRTVQDLPFLQGLDLLQQAISETGNEQHPVGAAAARYARNVAGSVVPAGVAGVARGIDPTVRSSETFGSTFASRIPGLTHLAPPIERPVVGTAQRIQGQLGLTGAPGLAVGLADALFNPATASADLRQRDPLIRELADAGYAPPPLSRGREETPADFAKRQAGATESLRQALQAMVQMPDYQVAKGVEQWAQAQADRLIQTDPARRGADRHRLAAEILQSVNQGAAPASRLRTRADLLRQAADLVNGLYNEVSRGGRSTRLLQELAQ